MDFDTIRMARVGSTTPKTSRQTPVPGFSTGDDSSACSLDLNEELLTNPAASFFLRVRGEAMIGAGIFDGDLVIVDRSLKPQSGKVVIAVLHGEMLIRRFEKSFHKMRLLPETNRLAPIDIDPTNEAFSIWGVVTCVIHRL
ncbi:MAG: translesion error-prone DNA polymerase V autoproteolytic subunit [Bacteroidetes bacterium]|nr:translesion error-prone DNA polymerase V autoproteolytic subunit [Bacteroidota bacterium]